MNIRVNKTKSGHLRLAIYVRKSKYREESESIENQIQMCKEYIFAHFPGVTYEDIVVYDRDENISGKDTHREDFQKMMDAVKNKEFSFIVCYKLDRLNRNVADFATTYEFLKSKNVGFISIKEHFDTSAPVGRLMMYLIASIAQMERETIGERVKDAVMFLATKGRWLGGTPPTGFDSFHEKVMLDGKPKKRYYLKENHHIEVVKLIYEKFLECGSAFCVGKHLEEKGIKTIKNNYYYDKSIEQILRNPVYCTADKDSLKYFENKGSNVCFEKEDCKNQLGIMPFNRKNLNAGYHINPESEWIVAVGKHQGTIKGKDWVAVQNIFANRKSYPHTHRTNALLSGMIECGLCDEKFIVKSDGRPNRRYLFGYTCKKKDKFGVNICPSKNLPGKKTEEQVISYIMNFDENKLKKDLNIKKFSRKVNKFHDKSEELKFEILGLEKEKDKYIDYLKKLTPESPLLKDIELKVLKLNQQIEKFESQKSVYDAQFDMASHEKTDVEQVLKHLAYFKKNFHNLDLDEKKSLLRLVINKLTWNGNELKIFLNGEHC